MRHHHVPHYGYYAIGQSNIGLVLPIYNQKDRRCTFSNAQQNWVWYFGLKNTRAPR